MGFDLGSIGMSALSTGFDMLSNYASAKQNYGYARKLNEQQFGFQQQLQKQQNAFNLDLWNKENEYNSASAQVQRLREAGLNPSMVFGQNSGTASPLVSSSPSVPNSAVPDFMKPVSFGDTLNSFLRTEVSNKELKVRSDMLDRQLSREDARIENERKRVNSEVGLNEIIGREKNQNIELSKEQANVLRTSIKQMNKQIDVYDKQIQNFDAEIAEKTALANKAREEGRFVEYRAITERMNAISQRITANATSALTKQQIKVGESVVDLNRQQANHLVQQIRNLKQTEKLNNIELRWRGKQYKADFELKQGQLRITKIQGDIADATQYAQIANAYISTVDNAAKTVSDAAGAAFDVYTFGAGSKLKFGSVENQNAQTDMYRRFAETNSPVSVSGFTLGK